MKALFWIPPWCAHGDPLFYRNCLRKHLIPQANTLNAAGFDVDITLPALLESERELVDRGINVIELGPAATYELTGCFTDPSSIIYQDPANELSFRICERLRHTLASRYDVILLWETPVPFLERRYPEALIVHQMPGAFSRPPYPNTVTFDPVGLYKSGSLYRNASEIINSVINELDFRLTRDFTDQVKSSISSLQPWGRERLEGRLKLNKLALVPLQVSAHYSFNVDTSYRTQADFLLDILNSVPNDTGVVVTQYVTPRVSDTVLNADVVAALRSWWPNLIYQEEFDKLPSVSQYLLPLVDQVITCSSSVGLQALAWNRELIVRQPTFLQPFSTELRTSNIRQSSDSDLSTIAFLINRHQPLADLVVNDRQFLVHLLEDMVSRKRAGLQGLDLLPNFRSIDPTYDEKLLSSFAVERAARSIVRSSASWSAEQGEIDKFRRAIGDAQILAITFDVFDTLIKRPTETPADVYKFLEGLAIKLTNGAAEDFARVRETAEVETRATHEKGEITLDDIYLTVQKHYGFDEETILKLKAAEIDLELRFVTRRPIGWRLWQIACESGKPIHLISDMYLPVAVVAQMLKKAGYEHYKKLYVSSEYGVRKKEGGLFDVVLSDLKLPPETVLHIGDNKVADVEQPQARGMKTLRLVRALDRMRGNEIYKRLYPPSVGKGERARSIIAGLTANALFDAPSGAHEKTTHFQGSPYKLGYAALGPMLTGYML